MMRSNPWRLESVLDHGCDHEWAIDTMLADYQERHCLACGQLEARFKPNSDGGDVWTPWDETT